MQTHQRYIIKLPNEFNDHPNVGHACCGIILRAVTERSAAGSCGALAKTICASTGCRTNRHSRQHWATRRSSHHICQLCLDGRGKFGPDACWMIAALRHQKIFGFFGWLVRGRIGDISENCGCTHDQGFAHMSTIGATSMVALFPPDVGKENIIWNSNSPEIFLHLMGLQGNGNCWRRQWASNRSPRWKRQRLS